MVEESPNGSSRGRLTRVEKAGILAFCVGLFLFWHGPVWTHAGDPDASILTSYAPIPFLVGACLVRGRRLRLSTVLSETLLLAILKFGITATILMTIWIFVPSKAPERSPPAERLAWAKPALPTPRPPSRIPAGSTGQLSGRVTDPDGEPQEGALVYVQSGLERFVFEPPPAPASLCIGAGRFVPELASAAAGQQLMVTSADASLHTLHVLDEKGETRLNVAVPGSGQMRRIAIGEPTGLLRLRCEVHPKEQGKLLLLAHPFVTRAAGDGTFRLEGVPAGPVELAALSASGARVTRRVSVVARGKLPVDLILTR